MSPCTALCIELIVVGWQALAGKPTLTALDELCEAVSELPAAGVEREEHKQLLGQAQARVQLARAWEESAAQLLGDGSAPATLEQLEVQPPTIATVLNWNCASGLCPALLWRRAAVAPAHIAMSAETSHSGPLA